MSQKLSLICSKIKIDFQKNFLNFKLYKSYLLNKKKLFKKIKFSMSYLKKMYDTIKKDLYNFVKNNQNLTKA